MAIRHKTIVAATAGHPVILADTDMQTPELFTVPGGASAAYTHRAPYKHDSGNEDAAACIPLEADSCVLAIADGVGGLPAGASASRTALEELGRALLSRPCNSSCRDNILDGFEQANRAVLNLGSGAATTLVVAEIRNGVLRVYHAGDSLALVTGQRGLLKLQTVAHSPVGYAVESGLLDAESALHHAERNLVSNVIGTPDLRIEISTELKLAQFDTVLLASDAVADNLYQKEIIEIIRQGPLSRAAERLVQQCRERMVAENSAEPGHPDDLSLLLFRRAAAT